MWWAGRSVVRRHGRPRWGAVPEAGLVPAAVVEDFDVVEQDGAQLGSGLLFPGAPDVADLGVPQGLHRFDGHLILGRGSPWRKEAVMARPSKYAVEFRREAVELVRSSGRTIAQVARSLGISDGTLGNWVKADREARERAADPEALSEAERVELGRLRQETAQQQIDLEILRKAAAYSARETHR